MSESTHHATHPVIVKRLKRANSHLASVIRMIEDAQLCVDITQQLHAVEKAVQQAKRTLIQDHIDHCLENPRVGGSIPPPGTTFQNNINDLIFAH